MASPENDDNNPTSRDLVVVPGVIMPYIACDEEALHNLCVRAGLERYGSKRQIEGVSCRRIYASLNFIEWTKVGVGSVVVSNETHPSAKAQLKAELDGFCRGDWLVLGSDFHRLEPIENFVWQLKTSDLRLFGWFVRKDWLILHTGADANILHKKYSKFAPYVTDTVSFRESLGEMFSKPITSGKASDVISNRT